MSSLTTSNMSSCFCCKHLPRLGTSKLSYRHLAVASVTIAFSQNFLRTLFVVCTRRSAVRVRRRKLPKSSDIRSSRSAYIQPRRPCSGGKSQLLGSDRQFVHALLQ